MRAQASYISIAALALISSVAEARPAHPARHAASPHRQVKVVERHHVSTRLHKPATSRPVERAQVEADDQPEALAPIHVHHNRKIHRTLGSSAGAEDTAVVEPASGKLRSGNTRHPVKLTVGVSPSINVQRAGIVIKTPVEEVIPTQVLMPALYTRSGRLIVPPALKGSHEILVHQNTMADREGLDRVQDDQDLEEMREAKMLIALPTSAQLEVDERLPVNRRYCRPWTAQFLSALARAHYQRFHSALQVNSAVRTVEFQQRLIHTNGNAAPAEGSTASPHLTGQAVDLAKHGLSMTEIAWLRGYLMPLVQQGKVDVEEEFQQSCFHISVYQKYLPQAVPKREIERRGTGMALATAVR